MYILDSLYGPIEFDAKLTRCILSPEIQRLRDIRLSNINSLFFTGLSNINRYEHSIGTAYLATVNITANKEHMNSADSNLLVYAALFHDLANGPFGHSYEYKVVNNGFIPEERVGDVILETATSEDTAHQQPFFSHQPNKLVTLLHQDEIHTIDTIIRGTHTAYGKVLNNTIDIDNIDNVYRLSFHLGININKESPIQLAKALYCSEGTVYFKRQAVQYLEDWYRTRSKMYTYLLLNPDDFAAKCMLEEAIDITLAVEPDAIQWQFTDTELWGIETPGRFVYTEMDTKDYDFETKAYPVCVMDSTELKSRIEYLYQTLAELGVTYIHGEMVDFSSDNNGNHKVILKSGEEMICNNLVLALGRRGIHWLHTNAASKGFQVELPEATVGFRFEMPMQYLKKVGTMHPDFKARTTYNGYKYKSFCYCGGANGGRLKFENYRDYILLDGQMLAASDTSNGYGNFALLRQLMPVEKKENVSALSPEDILTIYKNLSNGQTIYQSYNDFKNRVDSEKGSDTSAKFLKPGSVYKLIGDGLDDFCNVVERIFSFLAAQNGVDKQEIEDNTNVIALELEGLWQHIKTDENFLAKQDGIYVGGDCSGEAQGIIQATIMGIKIAECIAEI